ncbi:MAG: hypothetical protein WC208_08435 [Gallionella sp.]|jgi:hypothetical protein
MAEKEKVYIVGMGADNYTPPPEIKHKACLVGCSECKRPTWIMVWNMDKTVLCEKCVVPTMERQKKEHPEDPIRLGMVDEDIKETSKYIANDILKRKRNV